MDGGPGGVGWEVGSTCDQNTLKICMKFSKINILYMYVCTVSKYPFKE